MTIKYTRGPTTVAKGVLSAQRKRGGCSLGTSAPSLADAYSNAPLRRVFKCGREESTHKPRMSYDGRAQREAREAEIAANIAAVKARAAETVRAAAERRTLMGQYGLSANAR